MITVNGSIIDRIWLAKDWKGGDPNNDVTANEYKAP